MKSSVEAFKLAGGLFIIPIMMAYTNLVDSSAGAWSLTLSIVQTLTIIIAIAVSIEGYLLRVLTTAERLLAFSTIPLILLNPFGAGFVGIIIIAGLILTQWRGKPQVT